MRRAYRIVPALSAAIVLSAAAGAGAQEEADLKAKARQALEQNRDAVVTVKVALKIKISMNGQELQSMDSQVEVAGTVVDPSGLVVVSESALDPMGAMQSMMGGLGAEGVGFKNEIGEVTIVLHDGKDVPARLVLRDKDLDLAFVAPQEKGPALKHVAFQGSGSPGIFDSLFVVRRLGAGLNRTAAISSTRIGAKIEKPRVFYACTDPMASAGAPVFDASGKPLGLLVRRKAPATGGAGSLDMSRMMEAFECVVLPSEDVADAVQQALKKSPSQDSK